MAHSSHVSDEIVERGQALYDQQIRKKVEPQHNGKFLVLDVDTGDYEIDADSYAAYERAAARHPDAPFYLLRVGFPAAVTLGAEVGSR
jgi:hypothetical protein